MPLYMHFTTREINALQLYARGQLHRANDTVDGDTVFWESLLAKLKIIWQHPMCCWCDSRDWNLDNPETIPDDFGCQHGAQPEHTHPCPTCHQARPCTGTGCADGPRECATCANCRGW